MTAAPVNLAEALYDLSVAHGVLDEIRAWAERQKPEEGRIVSPGAAEAGRHVSRIIDATYAVAAPRPEAVPNVTPVAPPTVPAVWIPASLVSGSYQDQSRVLAEPGVFGEPEWGSPCPICGNELVADDHPGIVDAVARHIKYSHGARTFSGGRAFPDDAAITIGRGKTLYRLFGYGIGGVGLRSLSSGIQRTAAAGTLRWDGRTFWYRRLFFEHVYVQEPAANESNR